MPEGDTIFRTARTLRAALVGQPVTRFHTQLAQLAVVDRRAPVTGRTIEGVTAQGKHLLIAFTGALVLRTHMRMHGSWHIYRPAERWRGPSHEARIVIETTAWVAIAFRVNDAELIGADELARHGRLAALGPDLLADSPDLAEARQRLRGSTARHIGEALLSQQTVAGIGNVYKSEVLFLSRINPFDKPAALSDAELDGLLTRSRALLQLNVAERPVAGSGSPARQTTGRLNPREPLWVYARGGRPCRRCGTLIRSEGETGGRRTYWCPSCQPPRAH
jgi:endonuclease-8